METIPLMFKLMIELNSSLGTEMEMEKMMIGNGLRDIQKGGDEVIIEKNGFGPGRTGNQRATGKSTYTRFFKKVSIELEQN